MGTGGK